MKKILSIGGVLVFVLLILTVSPSCKKTVTHTIIDTVQTAWQPLPLYNGTALAALSSYNLADTTLLIGGSFGYTLVPVNSQPFNNLFTYPLPGTSITAPVQEAPFLNASLCAYTTATSFYVYSVPPHNQYSSVSYTPTYTPGAYSRFQEYHPYPTLSSPAASFPVIRNKYALVPVETVGNSNTQARFDLVSFDSAKVLGTGFLGPDTAVAKSIVVTVAPGTIGFTGGGYYCASYYDKFFVYYSGQFFRIDTTGNVKVFGYTPAPYQQNYSIANMFTVGNNLYANSGGIIFVSADRGETWSLFNDFSQTNAGRVVYRNVGNDLYATYGGLQAQIWKVVIAGNTFHFSELNTDGLGSNLLTSITRCGKYVFVTTPTGVFYRDSLYFNQLAKPIR
jgi:hypothetical protein